MQKQRVPKQLVLLPSTSREQIPCTVSGKYVYETYVGKGRKINGRASRVAECIYLAAGAGATATTAACRVAVL